MSTRIGRSAVSTSTMLRACEFVLLPAGFLLLGYCAYTLLDARLYQQHEKQAFEAITRSAPARGPALAKLAARRSVVGEIEIRRVGISAIIAEGDDRHTLRRAVGHVPGTALPGQPGNVVLAAHRDTLFRPLRKIHKGDVIAVATWTGSYRYRVESIRVVAPGNIRVLEPTKQPTLTLVTCFPFYFVGSAPKRFVVRAGLISG
jgi:sortase A